MLTAQREGWEHPHPPGAAAGGAALACQVPAVECSFFRFVLVVWALERLRSAAQSWGRVSRESPGGVTPGGLPATALDEPVLLALRGQGQECPDVPAPGCPTPGAVCVVLLCRAAPRLVSGALKLSLPSASGGLCPSRLFGHLSLPVPHLPLSSFCVSFQTWSLPSHCVHAATVCINPSSRGHLLPAAGAWLGVRATRPPLQPRASGSSCSRA